MYFLLLQNLVSKCFLNGVSGLFCMISGHLKLPLFNSKALLWSFKAETHRGIQLELSSKSNNSILVEWHHKPLSKVNGVPIERTFYHRKWTLRPKDKAHCQKIIKIIKIHKKISVPTEHSDQF